MEIKSKQQQTINNNNKQHLNELQEKDRSMNKLAKELETMKTDLGNERDEILKGKEFELSNFKLEFARIETELRSEMEEQKKEFEFFQTQSSKNEENRNFIEDLTSEKSNLEQIIEEWREENKKLTLELKENPEKVKLIAELNISNDIIAKLKQSNLANEELLRIQINELENGNKQLKNKMKTQMDEHNKQITAFKQYQQDTEKSRTMIETKDKRISELEMQLTKQQEKEQTYQTQMEKQIKELNEDFEQLKSDNVDLEVLVKSDVKNEKFLAVEDEKHFLEEQIETLRWQIESLTEKNEEKIHYLEGSFDHHRNQSEGLEMQLGGSKSDYRKLQIEREQSQLLVDDLITQLETLKNDFKSEQLINSLNTATTKLEQNDSVQKMADLERLLAETEGARKETEEKLGAIATVIAYKDTRIQTLEQNIVKNVNIVKLKSLPNPSEYQGKQAIYRINKRYELGVLIGIFDVPGKVGFKSVIQKYVGIKLYNPVGSSNGEFRGKRYFECEPNCGLFVPFEDVLIPII